MSRVVVVGAGVMGLTCAVRLAETGRRVDVLARDLPRETTSVVAAALWYPYLAEPRERVSGWAGVAHRTFAGLCETCAEEDTGLRMLPGTEVHDEAVPDPWWADAVPDLARAVPPPGYADAWSFAAPVIDMPYYLDWLRRRLLALDGTITRMSLGALPRTDDVVVNCAGIGARLLARDTSIRPVRGQVVLVRGLDLDRWWLEASGPTYVVPRRDVVVVGGTEEDGEWSRTPSPQTATSILQRASRLVPALAGATVVGHRVGLRPVRPEVRLEVEGRVVHCYGHGGAGVTLSWGCAAEVAALVADLG